MGLFNKKKKDQEAPANPYANPMTPYQEARNNMAQGKTAMGGLPSNPRAASVTSSLPPYSSPSAAGSNGRFGDEKFGSQDGYGSNRYDSQPSSARGSGGYGGFDDDAGKGDLFGGAAKRYVPQQQNAGPSPAVPAGQYGNDSNRSALMGNAQERYNPYGQPKPQSGADDDEYGGYGAARELTEEEKEEQEVDSVKGEIKQVKQDSKASVGRSLAIAEQALETAYGTRARAAGQRERLHNTERQLDIAASHSIDSEEKTKKLTSLNRSMFAVHVNNPFTEKKRTAARDQAIMDRHQKERDVRESTRKDAFRDQQHMDSTYKPGDEPRGLLGARRSNAERSKFQFEADEEDEELENDIDDGLDRLGNVVGKLNLEAKYMNEELQQDNKLLERIGQKSDAVDDRVRLNREKLNRIH